jgi:ATP-binding cassette subfamily B multidrug efflux pump
MNHGRHDRQRRGTSGVQDVSRGVLIRAIGYLGRYPKVTLLAYGALFVATAAQLPVPQLLQNIIDKVTSSFMTSPVLELPANVQTPAAERLGTSVEQLRAQKESAVQAILFAVAAIVIFTAARGLFSFVQAFRAQTLSQNVAFDFRNDLFAKTLGSRSAITTAIARAN